MIADPHGARDIEEVVGTAWGRDRCDLLAACRIEPIHDVVVEVADPERVCVDGQTMPV